MKSKLYKVLAAATSEPLFFAYQNGNKLPSGKYMTVYVLNTSNALPIHHGKLDNNGNRSLGAHKQSLVQLDYYNCDCFQDLEKVLMNLGTQKVLDICDALDVSISDINAVKMLPVQIDGAKWQNRATVTFRFNYTATTAETTHIIESAEIKGDYING